jgi:hypothetical protein
MNIDLAIKTENARHEKQLKTINLCKGLEDYVDFCSGTDVYVNAKETKIPKVLHEFRKKLGDYKLECYHMNGHNLSIWYKFSDILLIILCPDVESMLAKLSKGKCKLVKETYSKEEVICDL